MYTDVLRRSRAGGRPAEHLDPPTSTRLREIQAPTLVVVGTGDVPDSIEMADALARTMAGARPVRLPHRAHVLTLE